MNVIKILHKLLQAFRGGASRRDLFLAVLVGLGLGIIPGINLTKLILLFMLLFLNLNGGVAAVLYLITRLFRYLLAPALYQLGYVLTHGCGGDRLVRFTLETPVLAYLNWDVYAVMGGLVVTLIAGPLLATLLVTIINATHRGLSGSKLSDVRFLQVLVRIVVGKPRDKKEHLLKRGRCVIAILLLIVAIGAAAVHLDDGIEHGLVLGLEQVNGAEVNIGQVDLSLVGGVLSLQDLQVTDPAKPETNLVASDRLEMEISVTDLLRRRLVINRILSDQMTMSSPRETPGEVYRRPDLTEGLLDSLLGKLGPIAQDPIRYYEQIKALNEKLEKVKEYLGKIPFTPKERTAWELERRGYLRASSRPLLDDQPAWVIRIAKATGVILMPDLPDFTIEARNLSSDPSKLEDKPQLRAMPNKEHLPDLPDFLDGLGPSSDDEEGKSDDKPGLLDRILNR